MNECLFIEWINAWERQTVINKMCQSIYNIFILHAVAQFFSNINSYYLEILSKCRFQGGTWDSEFLSRWYGGCSSQTQRCYGPLPLGKEDVPCREQLTWLGNHVKIPVAFVCNVIVSVFTVRFHRFLETVVQMLLGKPLLGMEGSFAREGFIELWSDLTLKLPQHVWYC